MFACFCVFVIFAIRLKDYLHCFFYKLLFIFHYTRSQLKVPKLNLFLIQEITCELPTLDIHSNKERHRFDLRDNTDQTRSVIRSTIIVEFFVKLTSFRSYIQGQTNILARVKGSRLLKWFIVSRLVPRSVQLSRLKQS